MHWCSKGTWLSLVLLLFLATEITHPTTGLASPRIPHFLVTLSYALGSAMNYHNHSSHFASTQNCSSTQQGLWLQLALNSQHVTRMVAAIIRSQTSAASNSCVPLASPAPISCSGSYSCNHSCCLLCACPSLSLKSYSPLQSHPQPPFPFHSLLG